MKFDTTQLLDALGNAIIHSVWQVTLAVCFIFLFYKITNPQQARQRYFVGYSVLVLCLVSFAVTFLWYLPDSTSAELNLGTDNITAPELSDMAAISISETAVSESETKISLFDITLQKIALYTDWIGFLWVIGFLFYSVKYIIAFRIASGLRTVQTGEVEEYWQLRIRKLIAETGINSKTELMYSRLIENPLTIGFFKPLILVPSGFLMNLPPDQVEAVLLHEIAHIKRHDYVFNLIQTFIKTVFFYHPGIRFISSKIDTEREHLCDDFAVGKTHDPAALAKALGFLQLNSFNKQNSFAMNAVNRNHPFINRLKRLFGNEEQAEKMRRGPVLFPIFAIFLGALATTAYTEATPENPRSDNKISLEITSEKLISSSKQDSIPKPNISDIRVEKRNDKMVITEKDSDGNKLKMVQESTSEGTKRISTYLNGKVVKSPENENYFEVTDGKPVAILREKGAGPLTNQNTWFEIEDDKVVLKGKTTEDRIIWEDGALAMVPPPPPAPPVPPAPPAPRIMKDLNSFESLKGPEGLEKLKLLENLKDIDVFVIPPIPPFPPLFPGINPDSLPDGIDQKEFEKYIEEIEFEAERMSELAEEFHEKHAEEFEEAIERQLELKELWLENNEEISEEKLQLFEENREKAEMLFEENREVFEQQMEERAHELENLTEQLQDRFPQLFMDVDFELDNEKFHNLFEYDNESEHEHFEDLNEEDLKELRNDLRSMLIKDGFIKNKKKKAVIKVHSDEVYTVNDKVISENLWKKYHDFFHENELPHDNGMEIRIDKNIFQVGERVGKAFKGLTVFFD